MIERIENKLNMDDYDLEAVFTPAMVNILITAFIVVCSIIDSGYATNTSWSWVACQIIGSVAAIALLTRFVMNLFRAASHLFEDVLYGKDRLHFPTTSMLLYRDTSISKELKKRVRQELKAKYNMHLCSQAQEEANEPEARRAAKDAISLIRATVADNGDTMCHRKLKRYGSFRNFLGGALFCFPASMVSGFVSFTHAGTNTTAITIALILYLVMIVADYHITKSAATDYAESLITIFDKQNNNEA